MNANIRIKESLWKPFKDEVILSEMVLDSGRKLNVLIDTGRARIIVRTDTEGNTECLAESERIEIIECILRKCATFLNSVLNASITLYIQEYKLEDETTDRTISTEQNIIQEFVNSKYAYNTENIALKTLLTMYEQVKDRLDDIGNEVIEITIPDVFFIHKCDAKNFFLYALADYLDAIDITYKDGKSNILVLSPIKEKV